MNDKKNCIISGHEIEKDILAKQDIRQKRFKDFGFKAFQGKVAYAKGYPIYMGGYDGSGKSEISIELQLQASELYSHKHIILTGEVGQIQEIYLELYWKAGRKPYNKYDYYGNENINHQTDEERTASRNFINNHFLVVDVLQIPDIFRFDDLTKEITNTLNEGYTFDKIDTISIDGVYEVTREDKPQTEQQLEALLNKVYRYGIKNSITVLMTTHVANKNGFLDLAGGNKYPKPPTKYNWTMGMMWSRKGYQLLNIYRPSVNFDYFGDNEICEPNEVWVENEKSKPKGLTLPGRARIYFDLVANRYYEVIDGVKHFSREWWLEDTEKIELASSALIPNNDFDKAPF
jgi:hypothetical protein